MIYLIYSVLYRGNRFIDYKGLPADADAQKIHFLSITLSCIWVDQIWRSFSNVTEKLMVIHNTIHHDSPTEQHFMMRVVRTFISPMERQIDESIRINGSEADVVMNSGSEWRADRVPRAVFQAPGLMRRRTWEKQICGEWIFEKYVNSLNCLRKNLSIQFLF